MKHWHQFEADPVPEDSPPQEMDDAGWLGFWQGDKQVAGFITTQPEDYESLCIQWDAGELSWNQLVACVNNIVNPP